MQGTILQVQSRAERGKGPARRLRAEGLIPAVVYGHNDPIAIALSARDFDKMIHEVSESTIITLKVDEKSDVDVLIKEYDEDITTGRIRHIDFFEIERGKVLRTHIGLSITGSAVGVREGGILEHTIYDVEVECLPKDIPEHIEVDVSALALGESLHVSDLVIPEGVKVLNSPDQTVVVVTAPRAVEEETEEEEGEEEMDAAAAEEAEAEAEE